MRRMLFVGCGGTGGSVLSYMMDELRAHFARHGIDNIPGAWQFVHIDVPLTCDTQIPGVPSVPDAGGTYISCAPQTPQYVSADDMLSQHLMRSHTVAELATSLPKEPRNIGIAISQGAGQMRTIGRVATLAAIDKAAPRLRQVWDRMSAMESKTEATEAVARVPELEAFSEADAPMVVVVSSMAGGAGASMALDVCRVISEFPGVDTNTTAVFLACASVFNSLPASARTGTLPNALAMFGEVIASQMGSATAHDVKVLRGLGIGAGEGARLPFGRIFPIGDTVGTSGTKFGDGEQRTIYRGVARALAALVGSDHVLTPFIAFDATNSTPTDQNLDLFGWGGIAKEVQWAGFGYASLSMGRDRYLEYSAQRLASSAADHLVSGHREPTDTRSSDLVARELVTTHWNAICQRAGLPPTQGDLNEFKAWLLREIRETRAAGEHVATAELADKLPVGSRSTATADLIAALNQSVRMAQPGLRSAAKQSADEAGYRWTEEFTERVVAVAEQEVARAGFAYGRAVMERLDEHVRQWIIPSLELFARSMPSDAASVPAEATTLLGGLKNVLAETQTIIDRVLGAFQKQTGMWVTGELARVIVEALRSAESGLFQPLSAAMSGALRNLELARSTPARPTGLAVFTTTDYAAWPSDRDATVDKRWSSSVNEVVITPAEAFPQQYSRDLPGAVQRPDEKDLDWKVARARAVSAVITGRWRTTGGDTAPGGLVVTSTHWVPTSMTHVPGTDEDRAPSAAEFRFTTSTPELRGRAWGFVDRPGESFRQFADLSLREFAEGSRERGITDVTRVERVRAISSAFQKALAAGVPLIGIDPPAVQASHGEPPTMRYKFSEIPFAGLPVEAELVARLKAVPNIDVEVVDRVARGRDSGTSTSAKSISVFGSFRCYSPLAFDGVLGPIRESWNGMTMPEQRSHFWEHRRTRSIPAALAMTADERRAVIGGWFLGLILGTVKIPGAANDAPVRVYDLDDQTWRSFPHPLLTPPRFFRSPFDWLPALLESHVLACASYGAAPVGEALKPYRALRRLWDDAPEPSFAEKVRARTLLAEFISSPRAVPDSTSSVRLRGPLAEKALQEAAAAPSTDPSGFGQPGFGQAGFGQAASGQIGGQGGFGFSAATSGAPSTPTVLTVSPGLRAEAVRAWIESVGAEITPLRRIATGEHAVPRSQTPLAPLFLDIAPEAERVLMMLHRWSVPQEGADDGPVF